MAVTEHRVVEFTVLGSEPEVRASMACACGWQSGEFSSLEIARRALDAHVEKITTMTLPQALAIMSDHRLGLHDDWDDEAGCRWSGCAEAYWLVAEADG